MGLTALIDGDLVVHRICSAVQREIVDEEGYAYWWSDVGEVVGQVRSLVERLKDLPKVRDAHYFFSGPDNFRKVLEPTYKAQRVSPKPLAFAEAKVRLTPRFEALNLEADDLLGFNASLSGDVIVTADKDLLQVPGQHYNPYVPNPTIRTITPEEGTYNFLTQVLTGDSTDNYPGCPGIGPKTAAKILDADCSWGAVVDAYGKKGLTEEDAIHQARLAYILHQEGDYDWETGEVRLPIRMPQNDLSAEEARQQLEDLLSEEFLAALEVLTRVSTPAPSTPIEQVMWGHAQRSLYERLRDIHETNVLSAQTSQGS
jgi:DNA polymerase-1